MAVSQVAMMPVACAGGQHGSRSFPIIPDYAPIALLCVPLATPVPRLWGVKSPNHCGGACHRCRRRVANSTPINTRTPPTSCCADGNVSKRKNDQMTVITGLTVRMMEKTLMGNRRKAK